MQINVKDQLRQPLIIILAACIPLAITWVFLPHPAIAIAVGALPLIILLVLKQPFLMVLLFVLFSFFRLHEVFPQLEPFRIPLLLSIASLTALIWQVAVTKKLTIYWTPELKKATQFFVVVILGIALATNRPLALDYFTNIYWKIIVMTFAIAWLTLTARDFSLSLHLVTFSGLLVGLAALYNKFYSIGLVEGTRVTIGRDFGSVLGDPNDLSLVLLFPFSFALSLILSPGLSKPQRLFGVVTAIVLILAIIATQSRGGLLGVAAVITAFVWRRVASKTLLIICGALVLASLFLFAGISDRQSGGAVEAGIDESAMGRLYAWEAAFEMAVDDVAAVVDETLLVAPGLLPRHISLLSSFTCTPLPETTGEGNSLMVHSSKGVSSGGHLFASSLCPRPRGDRSFGGSSKGTGVLHMSETSSPPIIPAFWLGSSEGPF